jgi:hypothetical protein
MGEQDFDGRRVDGGVSPRKGEGRGDREIIGRRRLRQTGAQAELPRGSIAVRFQTHDAGIIEQLKVPNQTMRRVPQGWRRARGRLEDVEADEAKLQVAELVRYGLKSASYEEFVFPIAVPDVENKKAMR